MAVVSWFTSDLLRSAKFLVFIIIKEKVILRPFPSCMQQVIISSESLTSHLLTFCAFCVINDKESCLFLFCLVLAMTFGLLSHMSNVFSLFYQSFERMDFSFSLQVVTVLSSTSDHLYSHVQKGITVHG